MPKFKYQGPIDTAATLKGPQGEETDVMLWRGSVVELPADNAYVVALVAQGHLVPVSAPVVALADSADAPASTLTTSKKGAK